MSVAELAKIETSIVVTPITPAIGGIVENVDMRQPLTPDVVTAIRAAWLDRGVLFFRNQEIDEAQLEAFVSNFVLPVPEPTSPTYGPDSAVVHGGDTARIKAVTEVWHSDATWLAEPPVATALKMVQNPPVGGDTCWSNVTVAYEDLHETLRELIDKHSAEHWMFPSLAAMQLDAWNEKTQYVHPMVAVHPETGRKAIYVNEGWTRAIVGLPAAQSVHLLNLLYDHMKSPVFTMRWHWSPGDVAFWDNRAVQHFAVPDYDSGRFVQRIVTVGEAIAGPVAA